ncbi:MAG: hypothetical protein A3E81_01915 [Gammaproteobacteria bacterium RIFCSPHIGHO2_12_FULL_36_30]|nr:MAG: hypothetical protein A3E81_01915 [Gammaproteobacteria bacterium RIFCSPHIGHO2_12_FULL_36_30]
MRIFKTRSFAKWTKKSGIKDQNLRDIIIDMENGQVEASLGGRLFKQRIALGGKGKRGGARLIVAFIADDKSFFIYGFSKNEIENITTKELDALKALSKQLFLYSEIEIKNAIKKGELYEVT